MIEIDQGENGGWETHSTFAPPNEDELNKCGPSETPAKTGKDVKVRMWVMGQELYTDKRASDGPVTVEMEKADDHREGEKVQGRQFENEAIVKVDFVQPSEVSVPLTDANRDAVLRVFVEMEDPDPAKSEKMYAVFKVELADVLWLTDLDDLPWRKISRATHDWHNSLWIKEFLTLTKTDMNDGWQPWTNTETGSVQWSLNGDKEESKYIRVNKIEGFDKKSDESSELNPHLLRFYVEKVWKLQPPKLLISVTGGAKGFDLAAGPKRQLLAGLEQLGGMDDVWMITGGCAEGVMKYVGEARKHMDKKVPVFGFATWNTVQGKRHLVDTAARHSRQKQAESRANKGNKTYGKSHAYDEEKKKDQEKRPSTALDHNHSHFILVTDGQSSEFGKEMNTRSEFEAVMSGKRGNQNARISQVLKQEKLGWDTVALPEESWNQQSQEQISGVCVCVQGYNCV